MAEKQLSRQVKKIPLAGRVQCALLDADGCRKGV
jgi:hypothetical protein